MFPPPKPASVTGSCEVTSKDSDISYHVDLDEMSCDCKHGAPWRWDGKRWKPASLCAHKLKAVASLLQANPGDESMKDFYEESVGRRFNAFEAVSAMHKEVRRGDVEAALYWATVMIPHRGRHGVITYLRNILFEETRDLGLARYILKVSSKGRSVSHIEMQRAVERFCLAPKKWHLPWRLEIFTDEMRGYQRLAKKYGYDVAKGKDIIPATEHKHLRTQLLLGFKQGNRELVQYGLKGWFKSKSADHDEMKIDIFNLLVDISDGNHPNAFDHDGNYAEDVYKVCMLRMRNHGGVGYHELNAFCDALTGEPGQDPACTLRLADHKRIVNKPKETPLPLGDLRKIPLYAHDNHTWGGKAKMRAHRNQLDPGAKQTDLDFRLCGAYMGVAWRYLAIEQHATIDCKWGDVKWKPNWLWTHLDKMFY